MNGSRAVLASLVAAAGAAASGGADSAVRLDMLVNRVAIGCGIQNEKVLVITNTTGAPIAAGTRLSWDAVLKPNQRHQAGSLMLGVALQPDGVVKVGLAPASSCTAWFVRPLLLAPTQ